MNTKLKCLLLDDELPGLGYLKMLCEQIPNVEVVKAFNNPMTLLKEVNELEFDVCILDINMPEINGLQVADLLKGKPVIFTTAHKEFAAEAYDLDAVDYVRKPIRLERLEQAIEKARLRISSTAMPKLFFKVNSEKGKAILHIEDLAYFKTSEIDSRDKLAFFMNGGTLLLKNISFDRILELTPANHFIRINKKELIALKIIQTFTFDEIISSLIDKTGKPVRFNISETYREAFLKAFEG